MREIMSCRSLLSTVVYSALRLLLALPVPNRNCVSQACLQLLCHRQIERHTA